MSSSVKPKTARVKKSKTPPTQIQEVKTEAASDDKAQAASPSPEAVSPAEQPATALHEKPAADTSLAATTPAVPATPPPEANPAQTAPESKPDNPAQSAEPAAPEKAPEKPAFVGSPDCNGLKTDTQIPFFLGEQPVLFLQFVKGCHTMEGVPGFGAQSSWTGLGVPCTGGLGKIDKRGHEINSPQVVRFQIDLNCPMAPALLQDAERTAQKKLGIPPTSKLLALYPLTVEYWEFHGVKEIASKACKNTARGNDEISDAGVNSYATLTDPLTLCHWRDFTNTRKAHFPVRLYGRENSWNPSTHVYQVDANIVPENRIQFRIQVQNMRQLSDADAKAVLERCKAHASPRECESIFSAI